MWKNYVILFILSCFLVMGCSSKQNQKSVSMNYDQLSLKIAGLKVKNTKGEEVVLESLWKDKRVVVAFLRHFG